MTGFKSKKDMAQAKLAQPAQELQNAKKLFCEALSFGLVYRVEIGRQWDIERDKKADQLVSRLYTPAAQRKPLTDDIWILTSEYNDYDQHGEYFEAVFVGKPTAKQIEEHCGVNEIGSTLILAGGGRIKHEDQWYNLRQEEAAHGIKENT